jgi:hypothetical protein
MHEKIDLLNKVAILGLPAKSAKCILLNKARIKYIYGSGYTHCFKFRFLFLNHTVKITSLNRTTTTEKFNTK